VATNYERIKSENIDQDNTANTLTSDNVQDSITELDDKFEGAISDTGWTTGTTVFNTLNSVTFECRYNYRIVGKSITVDYQIPGELYTNTSGSVEVIDFPMPFNSFGTIATGLPYVETIAMGSTGDVFRASVQAEFDRFRIIVRDNMSTNQTIEGTFTVPIYN